MRQGSCTVTDGAFAGTVKAAGSRRWRMRAGALLACLLTTFSLSSTAWAQDVPTLPEPPATPDAEAYLAGLQALADQVQADPANAGAAIQGYVQSQLSDVEAQGLALALQYLTKVAAPVCPTVGQVSALVPIGINLNYPVASPIGALDKTTSEALLTTYKNLFTTVVTPITLPSQASAAQPYLSLAQALLGLLKVNWHTTYYPPGGGAPIVRDTPALLNLPMILDVDAQTAPLGYELCATMTLDLTTGNITQQVSRMPLARATLPVDVKAEFLSGVITPGYETKDSNAPFSFETAMGLTGTPVSTKLTKPGPTFNQTLNLTSALQFRYESTAPPAAYNFSSTKPGGTSGNGTLVNYSAPTAGGKFAHMVKVAGLTIGVASTPSPTAFEYCVSAKGFCSNEPAADSATETTSLHLTASQPVKLDQTSTATGTTCSAFALASTPVLTVNYGDAHLTGDRFFLGADTTANPGHAWADTGGRPASGCLSAASVTGTLPAGFTASSRNVKWAGSGSPAPATSKTGTINCPTGTAITGGSFGLTFGLSRYLCSFPPVNTAAPTIAGQPYVGSTLTANKGTWTPGAPNTPTFTYQWQRCDSAGANCTDIPGETNPTYTSPPGTPPSSSVDIGKRLRVVVKATNLDGSATASSALTPVITLPPPPANLTLPVITGVAGSGHVLHASNGTWDNGVSSYAYQWRRCDNDGVSNCVNATGSGATSADYTVDQSDEAHALRVVVTASNLGGSTPATSAAFKIPGKPVNTALPVIKNGASVATGNVVQTGDHLSVTNGSWQDATSFTYQWQRCDSAGANCSPIAGKTSSNYVVADDDVASTLTATVTGHNANQAPNDATSATADPTAQAIANNQQFAVGTDIPDGPVNAAAPAGPNSVYVGGSFDTVGKFTGAAGAIGLGATSGSGGTPVAAAAQTQGGDVKAVVTDGAGGYFLGGSFTRVLGTLCPALAHIVSDGAPTPAFTLDASYCGAGINGEVRALSKLTGSTSSKMLAVGGQFTVDGHSNLVFFEPSTGAKVFPPDGDPNAAVNAITNNGTANFYIGGEFTAVGTAPTGRLALEVVTGSGPTATVGRTTAWPANVCTAAGTACSTAPGSASVRTMVWTSLGVLIGGKFDRYYATSTPTTLTVRNNAVDVSSTTSGALLGWNPNPDAPVNVITLPPNPTSGTGAAGPFTVYLGGEFNTLGSGTSLRTVPRLGIFGLTITAGSASVGATNASGPSTSFIPAPNGPVNALTVGPGSGPSATTATLYAGGSFTSIYGQPRYRLAAINGQANASSTPATLNTTWTPNAGQDVQALGRDAANVFVGGKFAVLGGVTRLNAAEINRTSGVTGWNPASSSVINAIASSGGAVWLGGANRLGSVDPATGAPVANASVDGPVNALAAAPGGGVYAGGSFSTVAGQARGNLAAVDSGGSATGWNPGADGPVHALATRAGTVYVGGAFGTLGSQPRANVGAVDGSGAATGWNPGTNGAVRAIAPTNDAIFLGGSFAAAGGSPRSNLAAIDPPSGVATGWDPGADGAVTSLLSVGANIYAGGAFTHAGGEARGHVAQLDATTGVPTLFNPDLDGSVRSMGLTTGGVLALAGSFGGVGILPSPNLAFFGG